MIKLFCDSCKQEMPNPIVTALMDATDGACAGAIVGRPPKVPWLMAMSEIDGKPFFAHVCSPDCAMAFDKEHGHKTMSIDMGNRNDE